MCGVARKRENGVARWKVEFFPFACEEYGRLKCAGVFVVGCAGGLAPLGGDRARHVIRGSRISLCACADGVDFPFSQWENVYTRLGVDCGKVLTT